MLVVGVVLLFLAAGVYVASIAYACRKYEKVLLLAAIVVHAAAYVCMSPIPSWALTTALFAVVIPWRIVAIAACESWGGSCLYKYGEYPGTLRAAIALVRTT